MNIGFQIITINTTINILFETVITDMDWIEDCCCVSHVSTRRHTSGDAYTIPTFITNHQQRCSFFVGHVAYIKIVLFISIVHVNAQ